MLSFIIHKHEVFEQDITMRNIQAMQKFDFKRHFHVKIQFFGKIDRIEFFFYPESVKIGLNLFNNHHNRVTVWFIAFYTLYELHHIFFTLIFVIFLIFFAEKSRHFYILKFLFIFLLSRRVQNFNDIKFIQRSGVFVLLSTDFITKPSRIDLREQLFSRSFSDRILFNSLL